MYHTHSLCFGSHAAVSCWCVLDRANRHANLHDFGASLMIRIVVFGDRDKHVEG